MAIFDLTENTAPLATARVPVQNSSTGTTDSVQLLNLFAGGGQIKFPATQNASSNPNTLDDFERGTWTPADNSGAGLTFTNVTALYEKLARMVRASCAFVYPATADGSNAAVTGLPFVVGNQQSERQGFATTSESTCHSIRPGMNAITFDFRTIAAVNITNATMSGDSVYCTSLYAV